MPAQLLYTKSTNRPTLLANQLAANIRVSWRSVYGGHLSWTNYSSIAELLSLSIIKNNTVIIKSSKHPTTLLAEKIEGIIVQNSTFC